MTAMEQERARLLAGYVSTHVGPREGVATLDTFRAIAGHFDKAFGRFLPADRSAPILDGGCGNGMVVWWLGKRGFTTAEGVDASAEQVELARNLGVTGIMKDELRAFLVERPGRYALIILRDVLEHFPKGEIPGVLAAAHEALQQGGRLVVQTPNGESPFFGRIRYGDFTHETAFTAGSLGQLLLSCGFEDPRFHPVPIHALGLKGLVRRILWGPVSILYRFLLFVEVGRGPKIVTQSLIGSAIRRRQK